MCSDGFDLIRGDGAARGVLLAAGVYAVYDGVIIGEEKLQQRLDVAVFLLRGGIHRDFRFQCVRQGEVVVVLHGAQRQAIGGGESIDIRRGNGGEHRQGLGKHQHVKLIVEILIEEHAVHGVLQKQRGLLFRQAGFDGGCLGARPQFGNRRTVRQGKGLHEQQEER